jgi:hypothetical protein
MLYCTGQVYRSSYICAGGMVFAVDMALVPPACSAHGRNLLPWPTVETYS